jgi:hypothetical protein
MCDDIKYKIIQSSITKKYRIQIRQSYLFFFWYWETVQYASRRIDEHIVRWSPLEFDTYESALSHIREHFVPIYNKPKKKEEWKKSCHITRDGKEYINF